MTPKVGIKVTHVKKSRLLTPEEWALVETERVMRSLKREVLKQIRANIQQEAFSPEAKKALMRGMKTEVTANSVTIIATHPAFIPLLRGRKAGQMTWLVKARAPIPIVLDSGELIFRSATPRSMDDGSWYHPGRAKTTIIERARETARNVVRKRMREEIRKQIRATFRR